MLLDVETQINHDTIIKEDFSSLQTQIEMPSGQKINRTSELSDIIDHTHNRHLQHIPSEPNAKHILLSNYDTFSKIHHVLGHKENLNKCRTTETIPCILSDPSGLNPKINRKRKYRIFKNSWTLNNTLLNDDEWVIEEIKKESFKK